MSNEDLTQKDEEPAAEPEKDDAIQGIAEVPQQLLDKLPPEVKQQITTFLLSHQRIGVPAPNPIANKISPGHIDKIIDNSELDSQRDYESEKSRRRFQLGYAILALSFLVFLFIYLPSIDKELLKQVLGALVLFGGGFGSGIGASKYFKKSKDE